MNTNQTLRTGSALLMVVALLQGAGCNNAAPPPGTPPEIPPSSTLVIDFNEFSESGGGSARVVQPFPGPNYLFAAGNLLAWNVVITVTLVIPVAAFLESFKHEPVELADGTWEWAYSFSVNGVVHSAALQADPSPAGVDWTMLISKEGEYTDFVWFTGQSNWERTEGTWTLNYPPNHDPNGPVPFIHIDWQRAADDTTGDIRYTNVTPNAPENGGYIHYGITGEEPYNAFYTIASAGDDHTVEIEFNTVTIAGRVRDEIHFNDAEWHCWDAALQNSSCPE